MPEKGLELSVNRTDESANRLKLPGKGLKMAVNRSDVPARRLEMPVWLQMRGFHTYKQGVASAIKGAKLYCTEPISQSWEHRGVVRGAQEAVRDTQRGGRGHILQDRHTAYSPRPWGCFWQGWQPWMCGGVFPSRLRV